MQLSRYEESQVRIEGDETAVRYVKENIDRIWKQKPVYMHGDYHPGNLIYTEDGAIGVIDFNRWEVGDPYEEFYKLQSFGVENSIPYCIGQIDAYFNDQIPEDFWVTLAVYVAHASLYSIKWAERFGQEEIDGMTKRCRRAFEDYDYFRYFMPSSGSLTTDGNYMTSLVKDSGHEWNDFFIFAASGTEDFAYSSFKRQIEAMTDVSNGMFRWADNEREGNLHFLEQEGGVHNGEYAMEYFYNGLTWIWQ